MQDKKSSTRGTALSRSVNGAIKFVSKGKKLNQHGGGNGESLSNVLNVSTRKKSSNRGSAIVSAAVGAATSGGSQRRDHSVNNVDQFELKCRDYLDSVLKIGEYVKLPKSINNEEEKKRWKKAHCLRNKMKQYDHLTRRKLFQRKSVSNNAKFNRERYIILNNIPRYREAFPSVMDDPSNKIKEDIIRTYLKTHAAYFLSESRNGNSRKCGNGYNVSFVKKGPNSYVCRPVNKDRQVDSCLRYYCGSPPAGQHRTSSTRNHPKGKKKDLSYNLWKKIIIEGIKNGSIGVGGTGGINRVSNVHGVRSVSGRAPSKYEILVNGSYHNLKNASGGVNDSGRTTRKSTLSGSNQASRKLTTSANHTSNRIVLHNEKREDAYELKPSKTNAKMSPPSAKVLKSSSTYNSPVNSKEVRTQGAGSTRDRTQHTTILNTHSQHSNGNSFCSDESMKRLMYDKCNVESEKFFYKKDRFSLLGRIKKNKEIEVRLVLNKV
ncbi:Uncharacterized protein PCOAH_00021840 [Plasmodium coatneyi]|uniref:Uncharacterized protein n=1 Tax=Plasmodium coatneyi TaxID=208452 RepID=A0A1B1DYW2_9APIC|nr:Uncharacterized protein PCOAH_00021840 [Plasmodium coatneyi]ANQ07976.1 Uncharacterized protein PCOAH_00021840 [Plasmodium coatneyi]